MRNPAMLSDRPANNGSNADPNDARQGSSLGHVKPKSEKVEFAVLPNPVKNTIRDMNLDTKVKSIWNVEGGYYVVQLTDGRYFQVGHEGKLIEPPAATWLTSVIRRMSRLDRFRTG